MKVGDLVCYKGSKNILVIVASKPSTSGFRGACMFRCFSPRINEFYWFYPDTLETVCK